MNLQLFGGRGGSSGSKSGGGGSSGRKYTADQIRGMSRNSLLTAAKRVYVKQNTKAGLSKAEAEKRFSLLSASNSDAALRRYIKRYQ